LNSFDVIIDDDDDDVFVVNKIYPIVLIVDITVIFIISKAV
jgi:hypothetical protein